MLNEVALNRELRAMLTDGRERSDPLGVATLARLGVDGRSAHRVARQYAAAALLELESPIAADELRDELGLAFGACFLAGLELGLRLPRVDA